jgi:Domain of unknown function (DUF4111)/Nucleotidyltransferase domain
MTGTAEERAYLRDLVERLRSLLGEELVGVYAGGSYALGDYDRSRSDLDVAAVAKRPLAPDTKTEVVEAVRHEALPCPARGLELVVYTAAAAAARTTGAAFELNLNSGAAMPFRADAEPVSGERHWFAIDRSILGSRGIALVGPPAEDVFASAPAPALQAVVADALRWYRHGGRRDDAVLNACRSLRFADEGVWSSKAAAGRWALDALAGIDDPELVAEALEARTTGAELDARRVDAFLAPAVERLAR